MTEQTTANAGSVTGMLSKPLTNENASVTISDDGNTPDNATSADQSGSEDTLEGLKAVIEQQRSVIDVLTKEVGTFKDQWETAIRQGAAIGNVETPNSANGQISTDGFQDDYKYLKDLDYRLTKEDLLK